MSAPVRAARPRPAPRPQPARRPQLRVVEAPAATRRRSGRSVLAVAGIVAVACMLALAAFNAQLVSNQGRLDSLERQVTEEQARYAANRLQVAELESPARIVREAQEKLGMVAPASVTYLTPSGAAVDGMGGTEAAADDGAASWGAAKPYLGGNG